MRDLCVIKQQILGKVSCTVRGTRGDVAGGPGFPWKIAKGSCYNLCPIPLLYTIKYV